MKSAQCSKGRWCNRCELSGCECDCHNFTVAMVEDAVTLARVSASMTLQGAVAPPPHPYPFDHGKYRVAEEPLGTDPSQPWVLDYCLECKEPTWGHNAKVAEKHETMCETCAFMLMDEGHELRVKAESRRARTVNPWL